MQNWDTGDTQCHLDKFIGLLYGFLTWARGPQACNTWLKPWGIQSGHLTLCIHNTFTFKMHFPICAVIFIWLVVLEIYFAAHIITLERPKEKAKKRNMRQENKVGNMRWKLAESVNISCKQWRDYFFYFTVMLESFSFWKYKNSSHLKAVLRVCEMSSYSIQSTGQTTEPTPKWPRRFLETFWLISKYYPWKKKDDKAGPKQAPHSRGNTSHAEY